MCLYQCQNLSNFYNCQKVELMDVEIEDYFIAQQLDMPIIQQQKNDNSLFKHLLTEDKKTFMETIDKMMTTKDESFHLVSSITKMQIITKATLYNHVYRQTAQVINEINSGSMEYQKFEQANLFNFIIILDKHGKYNTLALRNSLQKLLQNTTNFQVFFKVLRCLMKMTNHSQCKQQKQKLAKMIYNLQTKKDMSQFKIAQKYHQQAESDKVYEDQILMKLSILLYASREYRELAQDIEKTILILQKKPFVRVFEYVISHEALNNRICRKLQQQMLNSKFMVVEGQPKLQHSQSGLHPELLNNQKLLKTTIKYGHDKLIRELREQNLIIENQVMYFKYDFQVLNAMKELINMQDITFRQDTMNFLIDLLKKLKANIDKPVKLGLQKQASNEMKDENEEKKNQLRSKQLFSELFDILAKYFMACQRIIDIDMQLFNERMNEETIQSFLKMAVQWLQKEPENEASISYGISLLSISAHLFIRNQYYAMTAYNSSESVLLRKIMNSIPTFTHEWKILKKIKLIIESWGRTIPQNDNQFVVLVKKFLNYYFSKKTTITARGRSLFNPMFESRNYIQVFSTEASKQIIDILQNKIKVEQNMSEQKLSEINNYIYKMGFLFAARIRIPQLNKAADLLYHLYQHQAHRIPLLHNYRTLIIKYADINKDNSMNCIQVQKILNSLKKDNAHGKFLQLLKEKNVKNLLAPLKQQQKLIIENLQLLRILVNTMELKSEKQKYSSESYNQIIKITSQIVFCIYELRNQIKNQYQNKQTVSQGIKVLIADIWSKQKSLYSHVAQVGSDLTNVVRYYMCNIGRLLEKKQDQMALVKAVSGLIVNLSNQNKSVSIQKLFLINDMLGISQFKPQTHLKKPQILKASGLRHGGMDNQDQFLMIKDQYIPIIIASTIYSTIRNDFITILKNLLKFIDENHVKDQKKKKSSHIKNKRTGQVFSIKNIADQLQFYSRALTQQTDLNQQNYYKHETINFIKYILFPTINYSGSCYFNNNLQQKAEPQHAYAILSDQFQALYSNFKANQLIQLEQQIVSLLQECKSKNQKVVSRQIMNQQQRNRPVSQQINSRRIQQTVRSLSITGYEPQIIEIAIDHTQSLDHGKVIDYIENNFEKIIIEISKKQTQGSSKKTSIEQQQGKNLMLIKYQDFIVFLNKGTKKLIKILFPEMYSAEGDKVKDLIFICLESFKDQNYKNDRYNDLAKKLFQQVDNLNKQFNEQKLKIITGSIQQLIVKRPVLGQQIHQKSITTKLLTFIEKCHSSQQKIGESILAIVNQTLPTPDNNVTLPMLQYLMYISDILMNVSIKSVHQAQILYKMTKTQNQQLQQRVLNVVCNGLRKDCLKNKIFSLISIVLQSDIKFTQANIQFDIKSFIIENCNLKKDPKKKEANLLQISNQKFSRSFKKYDENSQLGEVCKLLFYKKKNQMNLFFDKNKHDLFSSEILNSSFLSYQLPMTQKIIVSSMINMIVSCEKQENKRQDQINYITELYKILQHYKILIPYCLSIKVEGEFTFFQWMIKKQFSSGRGDVACFITFLIVRNGLFLNEKITFSDYIISKFMKDVITNQETRKNKWVLFALVYFMQLKNFNTKTTLLLSQEENKSLRSTIQKEMQGQTQIAQNALLSQALYLIYKNQLVKSLLSKYKIREDGQFTLQKQFLNMNLFYIRSSLSRDSDEQRSIIREENNILLSRFGIRRQDMNTIVLGIPQDQDGMLDDQDEADNSDRIIRQLLMRRLSRQPQVDIQSIFIPIQEQVIPSQQIVQEPQQPQHPVQGQQPIQPGVQQAERIQNSERIQQQQVRQQGKNKQQRKESLQMEEQNIQQQKEQTVYLEDFIRIFQTLNIDNTQILPKEENKKIKLPQHPISKEDLPNSSSVVNIKQPKTILTQDFSKTQVFKQKMIELAAIVDPAHQWVTKTQQKTQQQQNLVNNQARQALRTHVYNSLLQTQRRQQPVSDHINMGRILQTLQQYRQPLRQEPKMQEKMIDEKNEQKVQQNKGQKIQQGKMEEQKSRQKKQQSQKKEEQQGQKKQQPEQPQMIEQKQEKPENKQQEQKPKIQGELQMQPMEPELQNESQQLNQQQPAQQRPTRQVLVMLGLPQTFLQDVGIDGELFDQLPQDMQIEQLNHFHQEQQRVRQQVNQRNNQQGGEEGVQERDPVVDLQNQNVAFLASLDPQLRAQTLMEATPEFLLTLPPQIRAEAQNHRQRFIGQMIQNQELEEQELINYKSKKSLVYPNLQKDLFPQINQEAAKSLFRNFFIQFQRPKSRSRLNSWRILLQNKKTQQKAVNTLIYFSKNIDNLPLTLYSFDSEKSQWVSKTKKPETSQKNEIFSEILNQIYLIMIKSIYKNQDFLKGKFGFQCFWNENLSPQDLLQADKEGYYPLYELINLSIQYNHRNEVTELIKKVTNLPKVLLQKIVEGIRKQKFTDKFYHNLEGLSKNSQLKQIFLKQFPEEKPPKYQILSKVLKYDFAVLPYLRKTHMQALKLYQSNPSQELSMFLNEIFRVYSQQNLSEVEDILGQYKHVHFQIIKQLYAQGKILDTQPIGVILKFPHLLDFETKRFIFQNNPNLNKGRSRLHITVNRKNNIFMESYNQIMSYTPRELQNRVKVSFLNEPAEDAGGVKKQWYLQVSKQIFNGHYGLFQPSSSGNTYQINPKSYVNPEHLSYLKFIGRFVAKALMQGMLIDAYFTPAFYKQILGQKLQFKDLQQQDYNMYTSLKWFSSNKLSEEDQYTFSYLYDYFGKIISKDLVPNGENIKVTEQNKLDYIEKYALSLMRDGTSTQMQKFLEGFYQILPKEYISFFQAKQLELMMSGMPNIDLEDLKQNVEYVGYNPTDNQIQWFWEILQGYTNEELAHLIQFITGTSKIPLQGFSQLRGMNGLQKLSIHKDCHTDQLPKSHTCFNQFDLPAYGSKQLMKQRLRVTITWGSSGFGFL